MHDQLDHDELTSKKLKPVVVLDYNNGKISTVKSDQMSSYSTRVKKL